jgi:hypothetical protein
MRQVGWALRLALAATLLVGVLPATAAAQGGSRQSAELRFVEREPGMPSALILEIDYVNPADPAAKPPAVRNVVEDLAEGARIDTSIPDRCTATDAQLMLQGAGACPQGSRVGSGTVRIDTGFPEPGRFIDADTVFLNNTDELILVSTERGSGARVVTRAEVRGRRIETTLAPLPGTPPDGAAIDVVDFRLDRISRQVGGARRGYITTPPECPRSGDWLNSVTFTYADGASQTVLTRSLCVEGGGRGGRCANHRNGTPGRDRLAGTAAGDRLFGFRGDDRLRGRRGRDCLHGGRGDDVLRGGRGRDRLRGGRGDDVLRGGRGRDRLFGGPGVDICRGGRGKDRFQGCEQIR